MRRLAHLLVAVPLVACGDDAAPATRDEQVHSSDPPRPPDPVATPAPAPTAGPSAPPPAPKGPLAFVAVTMNTGTNDGLSHDALPDDGYSATQAKLSSDYYGNGLAWKRAIDDTKAFFGALAPDVVVFQEIFHPGACPSIPLSARPGFVCETWTPGDPTVVQMLLGAGYQVACHLGKPDKCAAVKKSFGNIRGCASDLCLEGLAGAQVPDCGGGSRVGRGVIDLAVGGSFTLVNVHGSSGFKPADTACRTKQVEQVFVNLTGGPAANGTRNLVMGDFNTDPGRLENVDPSAARWNDFVGKNRPFRFISDVGSNAAPSYGGSLLGLFGQGFDIDHVVSDGFEGKCWTAGITAGHPDVTSMVYFDHKPVVCNVTEKQ